MYIYQKIKLKFGFIQNTHLKSFFPNIKEPNIPKELIL